MKHNSGFTLIEVAIVMIIIGFALAASIGPLTNHIERSKVAETDAILNDVMEALYGYAATTGRLPCPADAQSLGQELIDVPLPATTQCTIAGASLTSGAHGFVPGMTLNISGKYNEDELLLDAWNNPIRYSITITDNDPNPPPATATGPDTIWDFIGMQNATTSEMRNVTITNLRPGLIICSRFSNSGTQCTPAAPINTTLAQNAVVVIMSLGEDGARPVTGNDQLENAGEAGTILVAAAPAAGGTGNTYQVANDRVFVSRSYKNTTTGTGAYKHQIKWMSPNTLYAKMITAGQLP